jgi:hypothetical protein
VPTAKEVENALAILLGGKVAQEVGRAATATRRAVQAEGALTVAGRTALRGGKFVGRQAITKNPYGIAALLAYEGYIHRDEIADVAEEMISRMGGVMSEALRDKPLIRPSILPGIGAIGLAKRKVSRANRAVKQGMMLMKTGGKASTGAPPGKLSKTAFKTVTKAAGLANPKTKSVIGKGKSMVKKLARRLRKWW